MLCLTVLKFNQLFPSSYHHQLFSIQQNSMIVTSGSSSLKKFDNTTLNNILLRTDGFKNVFKGLTHKHSNPGNNIHSGTYTSIGKRTPARQFTNTKDPSLTKECESRLFTQLDRSGQYRRTQTAETKQRGKVNENRQKDFERAEQQESECFGKLLSKLGI